MAVTITHPFVSPVADEGDPNKAGPNEWNAAHTITGLGTAAEADSTDFATAAQGSKADTALQPAAIGVTVQGYDADLTAWSGVNPSNYSTTAQIAAGYQPLDADLTIWAGLTPSANAQSLVTAANYAAMRALLDLEAGTDFYSIAAANAAFQPIDADLTSWAGVTRASGFDAFAATPSSANLRALLTDETGAGIAYFVGGALGTPSSATLTNATGLPIAGLTPSTSTAIGVGSVELGHATDTTLDRGAAGFMAVEGKRVPSPGSQAAGDILYRGSTEWERLAKGTALQVLRQNSALTAPEWATAREVLTANRTYYVRTDGSNSNNGLANTAGGAFLTVQKAVDTAAVLDAAGFTITIQAADGTYTGAVTLANVVGVASAGKCIIQGNNSTPANVVISTTSADCFTADGIYTPWDIKDLKVQTTTSGSCLTSQGGSLIRYGNLNFGACAGTHVNSIQRGSIIALSNYAISGGATVHVSSAYFSYLNINGFTVTLTGTPAFSFAFATAQLSSLLSSAGNTFSGSATGPRFYVSQGGTAFTNGGGASYFPGNSAGTGTNYGASPYGLYA